MGSLKRLFYFSLFTLLEYVRSGRILVELLAAGLFFFIFFIKRWSGTVTDDQFFTLMGIFTLAITIYTMSSMIHLGDRPQGYVLLSRKLSRTSYLFGLYLGAFVVVAGVYLLISLAGDLTDSVRDLGVLDWLFGTLPLFLNMGLFMALLLMLSPLVFSTGWRLLFLGTIALAFSDSFLSRPSLEGLPTTIKLLLSSLQTIVSWPLVPALSGFALSVHREVGLHALVVIIAQVSLLIALLGLTLYVFSHRELVFEHE